MYRIVLSNDAFEKMVDNHSTALKFYEKMNKVGENDNKKLHDELISKDRQIAILIKFNAFKKAKIEKAIKKAAKSLKREIKFNRTKDELVNILAGIVFDDKSVFEDLVAFDDRYPEKDLPSEIRAQQDVVAQRDVA